MIGALCCAVAIARFGLDEAEVIALGRGCSAWVTVPAAGGGDFMIGRSDQIHHRNKGRGARLNDERWWMATALTSHDYVEDHKEWARAEGYLLPFQADADGRWGDGNQALETPALMVSKIVNS